MVNEVLSYYKLVNELKERKIGNYSVFSVLYSRIILAVSLSSSFDYDVSLVIRVLIFKELVRNFNVKEFFDFKDDINKAFDERGISQIVSMIEVMSFSLDKSIESGSVNYGVDVINFYSNNSADDIFNFYSLNYNLRTIVRSGWDDNHFNILTNNREKVSDHIVSSIILAILLDKYFDFDVDIDKVIKILSLHEIGESLIGDRTPYDSDYAFKEKDEKVAIEFILKDFPNGFIYRDLLFDFIDKSSNNSKFAYYVDKLEADLQCKVYQDRNLILPLECFTNHKLLGNELVKKIQSGARTFFDVWYLCDIDKFDDNIVFREIMDTCKVKKLG